MTASGSYRPLIAALRRNFGKMVGGSATARSMIAFLVLATVLILVSPSRTIQLQARTLSAQVELTSEPLAWDLTGATVCVPSADVEAAATPPCGDGETVAGTLDGPVVWPRDQRLVLNWTPERMSIRLLTEAESWPAGTTLRVSWADAARNGALAFSGYLLLGQEMSAGATGYVLDGSYAIYEQGLVSSWIGWSPEITRDGEIRRGDQLQIICSPLFFQTCEGARIDGRSDQYRNTVMASISVDHDGMAGLHVVATGAEANSRLELAYAGRDRVLLIKPSWVERAAASSSLLALSLLFSLLAPLLLPLLERATRKG